MKCSHLEMEIHTIIFGATSMSKRPRIFALQATVRLLDADAWYPHVASTDKNESRKLNIGHAEVFLGYTVRDYNIRRWPIASDELISGLVLAAAIGLHPSLQFVIPLINVILRGDL